MKQREFAEILKFAVKREEEAASFYREAGGKALSPSMRQVFMRMAGEEEKHKELLTTLDVGKITDRKVEHVPDLKIADLLVDVDYRSDLTYQETLILAMKREKEAFALYNSVAENTEDEDLRKLFQILAQEEAKHKLRLETEYDEHVLEGH